MPPHLDSEHFTIIVHVVLEHSGARGSTRSALVVFGRRGATRVPLARGQAVVLAGQGAVHQWEPLGAEENRMLLGIGLKPAASRRYGKLHDYNRL